MRCHLWSETAARKRERRGNQSKRSSFGDNWKLKMPSSISRCCCCFRFAHTMHFHSHPNAMLAHNTLIEWFIEIQIITQRATVNGKREVCKSCPEENTIWITFCYWLLTIFCVCELAWLHCCCCAVATYCANYCSFLRHFSRLLWHSHSNKSHFTIFMLCMRDSMRNSPCLPMHS